MMSAAIAFGAAAQEISFSKTLHEFGNIAKGADATYRFEFTNTGKAPLVISDVQSTCGCTVPAYPKGTPINPGESNTIAVRYNRTDNKGAFNRSVMVKSNAIATPDVRLTVTGIVN